MRMEDFEFSKRLASQQKKRTFQFEQNDDL